MSIRLKILIALLFTGVIPALCFWWFTETILYKGNLDDIQDKLQVFADLKAERISQTFQNNSDLVTLISKRKQMRVSLANHLVSPAPNHLSRIEKMLTDANDSVPTFEQISIVTPDRKIIASTDISERGKTILPNAAFSKAMAGSYGFTYIITPDSTSPKGEKIHRLLCGPIFHEKKQIAVIVVRAHILKPNNLIDNTVGFGGEGRTRLVRLNKNMIERCIVPLTPERDGIGLILKNGDPLIDVTDLHDTPVFRNTLGQEQYLIALSPVYHTNIAVITDIDSNTALNNTKQLITFARTIGIMSILSVLLISVFVARSLSRPLRKVAQTAKRVAMGDLDARVPITTHDEVGQLGKSFNRMAENLIHSNRTLEKKVEQRTAQLETTQHLLIQSDKLESLGRMAAGVAHEVKNPLFVIQSGLDFFELTLKNADEPTQKTLRLMDEAVQRANSIVLGLLELSRSEDFELKPRDVNELVDKSLVLIDHALTDKSIYMSRDLKPDIPELLMDFHKMEQVLINLLVNAIQAAPKGGSITIKTFTKQLAPVERDEGLRHFDRLREDDDVAVIEITNTGSPIEDENMRKLFDPFFTTKTSNEGTGLGLAVCKTIIDLHSGNIHVENVEIPEGVRVSVTLKITTQQN